MPAHAHLNLLGWVSLFLMGIFYHLHPTLDRSRAAIAQVCIWIAATLILTVGIGLIHTGRSVGDPIAAVGAFIALADMIFSAGWLFDAHAKKVCCCALPFRPNESLSERSSGGPMTSTIQQIAFSVAFAIITVAIV